MKTNLETNMEDILNLSADVKPIVENMPQKAEIVPAQDIRADEVETDYQYARNNLKAVIDEAQKAIDDLSTIAQTTEAPRAYEVLGNLMKTIVDANQSLIDLQKKVKALKGEDQLAPKSVTNALFVGTTAELQNLIKSNK
jgi:hypothetical protein